MPQLGIVFLLCLLLFPVPSRAGEALSVGSWWCMPLSERAADCRRYVPAAAPTRGESVIVSGDKIFLGFPPGTASPSTPLRLLARYTSNIVRHQHMRKDTTVRLRFALPGTVEGKEPVFNLESAESAYIMYSGGSTSLSYARLPGLDAALDAAARSEPQPDFLRGGIISGEGGVPLLRYDAQAHTLTALHKALISCMGSGPTAIREVKEEWAESGRRVTVRTVNKKIELVGDPAAGLLRLNTVTLGERQPLLTLPLDAAGVAAFR